MKHWYSAEKSQCKTKGQSNTVKSDGGHGCSMHACMGTRSEQEKRRESEQATAVAAVAEAAAAAAPQQIQHEYLAASLPFILHLHLVNLLKACGCLNDCCHEPQVSPVVYSTCTDCASDANPGTDSFHSSPPVAAANCLTPLSLSLALF